MMIPSIHLNGTRGENLQREYENAIGAVKTAYDLVQSITVHGRDYYVQDDRTTQNSAYGRARAEHDEHLSTLYRIQQELTDIYHGINRQLQERENHRSTR